MSSPMASLLRRVVFVALFAGALGFAPPLTARLAGRTPGFPSALATCVPGSSFMPPRSLPAAASGRCTGLQQRQQQGRCSVQMGLFGLGAPEVAVILVAAALILGPDKLSDFAKDAGKMAGELKEVPKEFQAGIAEGEASMADIKGEADAVPEKAGVKDAEVKKSTD